MHREELAEIRNKNNQNLNLTTKFPLQNQPLKLAGLALAVTDKCRKIPYSMCAFLFSHLPVGLEEFLHDGTSKFRGGLL